MNMVTILWLILDKMGILSLTQQKNNIEIKDISATAEDKEDEPIISETLLDEECETFDNKIEFNIEKKEAGVPQNIQEALQVKQNILGKIIIDILKTRPNTSCVRENMPTYILKNWNLRTRSLPREQFAKKVNNLIAIMARKGYLIIYKSINERIKLGWETFQGFL